VNNDEIILGFILRKKIVIPWQNLVGMEIFKVITHYLKVIYIDNRNVRKVFKTSLAFPGIINLLLMIQDNKPDVELNELLKQVLIFKRTQL